MDLTRTQLEDAIATGDLDTLVGASETAWFECKGQPYQIASDAAKRELAKDVSAFANASGGFLLIGLKTKASPTHFGDEVDEVRPFAQGLMNVTQYMDVLDAWIYPKIDGLEVKWIATKQDSSKGVVVITIPPQAAASKPYLIVRTLDGTKHVETVFGYAERKGDTSPPMSIAQLQAALRSGLNFDSQLNTRLDGIETLLRSGIQATATATAKQASVVELNKRVDETMSCEDIGKQRCLVLSATPQPQGTLKSIFLNSEGSLKRKLEHPPSIRHYGWDLTHHDQAKIIQGEYIRVTNGNAKITDLYRDGVLITAALASGDFLAWGEKNPHRINPLALIEFIYSFHAFYALVLEDFVVRPTDIHLRVELRNMHLSDEKSSLVPYGIKSTAQAFGQGIKYAPKSNMDKERSVKADDFDPLRITYDVVREVYLWFGLEEDKIPYFKEEGGVRVFDIEAVKKI
jgi:hypothetical protein